MAGFDLGSIIASANRLSSTQTQQSQGIADLNAESAELSQKAANDIVKAGDLAAQVNTIRLQGELQTQKDRVQAANAFGTNVGDASDIITQLGQHLRQTAIELTNQQKVVSDIDANSDLLTNPMGWLTDFLTGDEERAKRDALAQQFDTTQKVATGLNAATQATVQTQNSITESLTQASITATAEQTKLLAQAQASEQAIRGKQYGVAAIDALRTNGAQEFNRQVAVYSQVTEEARYQEGKALRDAQFAAMQEQRKRGKLEDLEYTDATTRVNSYRVAAGLPPVNETFVRRTLTQPGDLGDDIRRQEQQGMRLSGGEMKLFGNDPASTIAVIKKDQPNLPDSFKPAVTVLQQASQIATEEVAKRALDPGNDIKKNPAAQAEILNSAVKTTALQLQTNIQPGKGNPYEAPSIQVVLGENKALAESKFGKTVLANLSAVGSTTPEPNLLIASALSSVQSGELSINEARDGIVSFYQNSVGINNATGGFLQLGVPAQQGYRTVIPGLGRSFWDRVGGSLGRLETGGLGLQERQRMADQESAVTKPLDLTKPTDVTLALTFMKSKDLSESILKRVGK